MKRNITNIFILKIPVTMEIPSFSVIFYSTEDPLVQYNNITVKYYYTAFG